MPIWLNSCLHGRLLPYCFGGVPYFESMPVPLNALLTISIPSHFSSAQLRSTKTFLISLLVLLYLQGTFAAPCYFWTSHSPSCSSAVQCCLAFIIVIYLLSTETTFTNLSAHRLQRKTASKEVIPPPTTIGPEEQRRPNPSNYAIAFDIDGVLVRGKDPIGAAKPALALLQENNIPYIMLTNGGGHTEATHASMLSKCLSINVEEDQFFQSHTPYRSFANAYSGKWVLCLGGEKTKIKELACAYGFSPDKVLSSSDIVKAYPKIHPFSEITLAYHEEHGKVPEKFTQDQSIAAIFVFSSPRDWCLDLQICLDLLASEGGRLGTRSALNGDSNAINHGYQQDDQPQLFFCNPDLEWATSYAQPRLAQGAFRAALEGVWTNFTDGKASLQAWTCGKPSNTTYEYAEKVIDSYRRKILPDAENTPLRTIYMIGDNPNSDIAGAHVANKASDMEWKSVLVESGLYKAGTVPEHKPTSIQADVLEAVKWIMQAEQQKSRRFGEGR